MNVVASDFAFCVDGNVVKSFVVAREEKKNHVSIHGEITFIGFK